MSQVGRLKVRDLGELIAVNADDEALVKFDYNEVTPVADKKKRARRLPKSSATTGKATKPTEIITTAVSRTTAKKTGRTKFGELPPTQKRIDNFFKSCSKTYKIETSTSNTSAKKVFTSKSAKTKSKTTTKGRKRLFDGTTTDTETPSSLSVILDRTPPKTRKRQSPRAAANKKRQTAKMVETKTTLGSAQCIDLCSDSEEETSGAVETKTKVEELASTIAEDVAKSLKPKTLSTPPNSTAACRSKTATEIATPNCSNSVASKGRVKKVKACPPYKIIEGTTFAVDAFQYGMIEHVTHYFLTHFHMDHYIGLTRKFSMPLYMSPITARLVNSFIPIDERYVRIIDVNQTLVIDGIEVTAIDANHCPGAVMFIFKLLTGRCILHTGDFRACHEMESEPFFWNNDIDTIYLDTTYISDRYDFITQWGSIQRAIFLIKQFQEKHWDKRILYVCGAYLIGKEKFWSALAQEFRLSVWAEPRRRQALEAMQLKELQKLLCDNPRQAQMHVIGMQKLSYLPLNDYFDAFKNDFDILFALRPSGWEKNSRPQYRHEINIVGVEYSEHSSYNEMKRFVMYLKPRQVISTVPVGGGNLMNTAKVPQKWYKYNKLAHLQRNFQPSITCYMKLKTKSITNANNVNANGNMCKPTVSPIKRTPPKRVKSEFADENNTPNESSPLKPLLGTLTNGVGHVVLISPHDSTCKAVAGSPVVACDVYNDAVGDNDDDWMS